MTQMNERDTAPWYRQPWPWIIMLPLVWAVFAGVALLVVAVRSNDGLVVDDYYRQGRIIDQTLARSELAAELGLVANVEIREGRVEVALDADQASELPAGIVLSIVHPTRAGQDQVLNLRGYEGRYAGAMKTLRDGRWLIQIEDDAGRWRLREGVDLPKDRRVSIRPYERSQREAG